MTASKLGLGSIVLLGINSIVGSGIFLLPNQVYGIIGNMSLVAVLFGALLATGLALCFAEAASWFHDQNGGAYLYAKKAFGEFLGFEVGILTYFVNLIIWAVLSSAFIAALSHIIPIFQERTISLVGNAVFLLSMAAINLSGMKMTKVFNNVITIAKLIPLVFLICVGIFAIQSDNFMIQPTLELSGLDAWTAASLIVMYSYLGFNSVAIGVKDMQDPQKNVPKAIILVMLFSTLIYLLIFTVCIGVLGVDLASSTAPVAATAQKFFGDFGNILISVGTLISIGGINLAFSYYAPRSAEAMSVDGFFPAIMTKTNKNGTPIYAIVISTAIALAITLTGTFSELIKILIIANLIQILPTCIAILIFRKKYKNKPAPFLVPGGLIIPLFSVGTCLWLLSQSSVIELIWGLGALVVGVPLYFIFKKQKNNVSEINKTIS